MSCGMDIAATGRSAKLPMSSTSATNMRSKFFCALLFKITIFTSDVNPHSVTLVWGSRIARWNPELADISKIKSAPAVVGDN